MGGGDAAGPTGTPAGRQASKEPAAGGCPAPLLRPSHKGAQGPRFLLAPPSRPGPVGSAPVAVARAGLWAAAPAGVVWPLWGEPGGAGAAPCWARRRGRFRVGATALAKGLSWDLRSLLFPLGRPQLLFLLLMLRTVPPRPRGSPSASQRTPARPEELIGLGRI